jgi:hypothetical protein
MLLRLRLTGLIVILCIILRAQVYSPYYFLDTLKDKGITSVQHRNYKNRIYFQYEFSSEEKGLQKDADDNVTQFTKDQNVEMQIYLDRSLRYYYAVNQSDPKLKFEDWNYFPWKGNYYGRQLKNDGRYVGYYLFVMTVNGDTACTWKSSVFEKEFEEATSFTLQLWEENFKNMGSEEKGFYPLFSYVRSQKKTGTLNVRIDVYPGKLTCNSINDRGPQLLATGSVKFLVTKEDLKALEDVPDRSCKLKFQDYEENEILWGVKQ